MGKIADVISNGVSMSIQKQQQLLALDQKFSAMELEITTLKAENRHLQAQVNPLEREVERLKNQIQASATKGHGQLDELSEKALLIIASTAGAKSDVIQELGVSKGKGDHVFDILLERKLIIESSNAMGLEFHDATPDGRKYLNSRNLL
jgi:hypothetical protein